jgi:hypothetical protein
MVLAFDSNQNCNLVHHLVRNGKDRGFGACNSLFGTTKCNGSGSRVVFRSLVDINLCISLVLDVVNGRPTLAKDASYRTSRNRELYDVIIFFLKF